MFVVHYSVHVGSIEIEVVTLQAIAMGTHHASIFCKCSPQHQVIEVDPASSHSLTYDRTSLWTDM